VPCRGRVVGCDTLVLHADDKRVDAVAVTLAPPEVRDEQLQPTEVQMRFQNGTTVTVPVPAGKDRAQVRLPEPVKKVSTVEVTITGATPPDGAAIDATQALAALDSVTLLAKP
jgi:hypothetical protein